MVNKPRALPWNRKEIRTISFRDPCISTGWNNLPGTFRELVAGCPGCQSPSDRRCGAARNPAELPLADPPGRVIHNGSEGGEGVPYEVLRTVGIRVEVTGPAGLAFGQASDADSPALQGSDVVHGVEPSSTDAVNRSDNQRVACLELAVQLVSSGPGVRPRSPGNCRPLRCPAPFESSPASRSS